MLILLTSPAAILGPGSKPDPNLVALLKEIRQAGPVAIVSNRPEPWWFGPSFSGSGVQFLREPGRQNGEIISRNAKLLSMQPFDVVVLAAKREDVQMGKNGGAILVAADWSTDAVVKSLGIGVADLGQLREVINLVSQWSGQWWYSVTGKQYDIRALADLSTFNKSMDQAQFAQLLTNTVKGGGARLAALLTVTARSLLMEGMGGAADLVWGVYPSSHSNNDDSDVLVDFTHRLRTTVSKVRYAQRGQPLFIRHTPSTKRSLGGAGNRTDPTDQITTLHLNPFYKTSNRLVGKNVVVIDDCTTYGVSFAVAAAFLRKAGAAAVLGVALGKFGNQLRSYDIDILTDPFKPVPASGYKVNSIKYFEGTNSPIAQQVLRSLIK
jgi:hypothetical protein